jgi:hypothetical protein
MCEKYCTLSHVEEVHHFLNHQNSINNLIRSSWTVHILSVHKRRFGMDCSCRQARVFKNERVKPRTLCGHKQQEGGEENVDTSRSKPKTQSVLDSMVFKVLDCHCCHCFSNLFSRLRVRGTARTEDVFAWSACLSIDALRSNRLFREECDGLIHLGRLVRLFLDT